MSCPSNSSANGVVNNAVYDSVKKYYGETLTKSGDLKTSACCTIGAIPRHIRASLSKIPDPILERYYGCGFPASFPMKGLTVLDLGSGSGRDCYLMADLVGENGRVIGIDMTDSQLEVANAHISEYTKTLGYSKPNLKFVKGYVEFLQEAGIQDESIDVIISNCVVNLSPNKKLVLEGVWKALKQGGEFYFSDVYCDRRLPDHIRKHDVLLGECLGGALYINDFIRLCHEVGFIDPRVVDTKPIDVKDEELSNLLGNAKFYSVTYRLFKLQELETLCEDYGQVATYLGTIPYHPHSYALDDHHIFQTGKPMLVCGNTADMVSKSLSLGPHFKVVGDKGTHFGIFPCEPRQPSTPKPQPSAGGACC